MFEFRQIPEPSNLEELNLTTIGKSLFEPEGCISVGCDGEIYRIITLDEVTTWERLYVSSEEAENKKRNFGTRDGTIIGDYLMRDQKFEVDNDE